MDFLTLQWIGRERMRAYAIILFTVSVASLGWFFWRAFGLPGSDFLAFWSAARLVVQGEAARVYDLAATGAIQAGVGRSDVFAFVNPPPFLFIVAPFGLLPYPLAWIAWVAVTWFAWFIISRRFAPELSWPIAAYPGALLAAWHAQAGFAVSAFQVSAAVLLRGRPFAAGLCVGALVIKPHLAILFPVAFVAGRHWRAFTGAAIGAIGVLLLSWAAFGTATMLAYPQSWAVSRYLMQHGDAVFFLRQETVYAAVRVAGSAVAANVAQTIVSLGVIGLVFAAWQASGPIEGKMALLLAATPLATPYLFSYDLPFLVLPVCWLVQQAVTAPSGRWERASLLLFYVAPLATRALALPLGVNLMPVVLMLMVWKIWSRLRIAAG